MSGLPSWASGVDVENQAPKRRSVGATNKDLEQAVQSIARQTMANTQELRMLAPAIYKTVLLKASNPYYVGGDKFLRIYNAKVAKGGEDAIAAGEPWWWVLTGLVSVGAQDERLPSHEKQECERVWAVLQESPAKAKEFATICRTKKAYGQDNKKILLSYQGDGKALTQALIAGMVLHGARVAQGQAPRGANERAIQDWLEQVQS